MADLSKFGAKAEKDAKDEVQAPEPAQAHKCPVCGAPLPDGSRYCPLCGTLADRSPEGLAAFSSGPQYAMMKMQVAAVQGIQAEASAIRRNVQWLSAVNTVGWLMVVFLLLVVLTRI